MYNYILDGNAPFVYANYGSGIYENPIKKPIKTATRYVIDEAFGESNLKKTFYLPYNYFKGVFEDMAWRRFWNYLDSEGVV